MNRVCIAGSAATLMLATAWIAGAAPKELDDPAIPVATESEAEDRGGSEVVDPEAPDSNKVPRVPIYVSHNVGAPTLRYPGITRGPAFTETASNGEPVSKQTPFIEALVPDQAGYTLNPQPTLYWYLSDSTDHQVKFTLGGVYWEADVPEFQTMLSGPHEAGIHGIDLTSHDFTLKQGVTYMWYVSLMPNPEGESREQKSGGAIQLMTAEPELQKALDTADAEDHPFILAKAGIWYDTLSLLSTGTSDAAQRSAQRTALLKQVGLRSAAVP